MAAVSESLPRSTARVVSRGERWLGRWGVDGWLVAMLAVALVISELPFLLSSFWAPAGLTGVGTIWFVNDFAQYESAMRQGATSASWLIVDQFTGEPHAPALMFPLYVGIGKLAVVLGVSAMSLERLVEAASRVAVVLAVWQFCRTFATSRGAARWAFVLALFGSGFEFFSGVLGLGYVGNWSYELNGFGLLFAAPHVPLGMAASLLLACDALRPRQRLSFVWLARIALLSAALALLHPFHEPVLLAAMGAAGLVYWRSGQGAATLAAAIVAGVSALPVLLPTALTFSFDPFWARTYSVQNLLPSPMPHELLIDLGPTLILALVGAVWLKARVAPFGLVLWVLLAVIAMYAPVPYQRRFSFGLQPALAILAGNTLFAVAARLRERPAALLRLGVVAASLSSSGIVLASAILSTFTNSPVPVYRSTTDLDAAAAYLAVHAQPNEVILADWDAANYLAPRTPARIYGGHPVATLNQADKQFAVRTVFGHTASGIIARSLGVQWLVYGPAEADLVPPSNAAFSSGPVRVYRIG